MHTPSDDAIRERAYVLWIEAGSPEGNDLYFWHAAEQELAGQSESAPDTLGQDDGPGETYVESPEQPNPY